MAKHSAAPQTSWGQRIGVILLAILLLAGGFGIYQLITRDRGPADGAAGSTGAGATPGADGTGSSDGTGSTGSDDDPDDAAGTDGASSGSAGSEDGDGGTAAAPGSDDCTPVTVWAAPELLPAVEAATERAADDCFAYTVVAKPSATAQSGLRGGERPDVWVASSQAWPQLVAASGSELEVGPVIASSPVLLTGVPQVVEQLGGLGIDEDTDFAGLVQAYQQASAGGDAPVRLRVGDPRVDPASMALLSSTSAQLGSEAGSAGRQMLVVLAQTAVQGDPLGAIAEDPTTLVPATEQQIAAAGAAGTGLQGLALKGGSGVVQMPFVRVGDTGSAGAVDALEQQLTSSEAAPDLTALGLRAGEDGEAPGVDGVPASVDVAGAQAPPEAAALMAQTWSVIAPQSRILTLIDISGSMEVEVGDTTRIDLTREAAQTALSVLPEQTAIGLWHFATALDGKKDYVERVPLRALNAEVRSGVTQKDVLLNETTRLGLDTLTGDTGLHDSLWAAYQYMQAQYTPDSISSVVLLTDGINDDSTGGLSEKQVIDRLTKARAEADQQVTVVLIGMGPDVDEKALARLAKAAGGESLVLRDPRQLPQVFVDVVARRAP